VTDHPPHPSGETLLTVRDVADRLRVTRKTITRWCRSGTLPATRAGREYRIRPQALRDYLAARDVAVAHPTPGSQS